MNSIKLVAVALIVAGVLGLAYGGFSYTKDKDTVSVGPVSVSAEQKGFVSPAVGAVAVVAGLVLVAVGRKAATAGMGLAEAGVKMNDRGVIEVDGHYETSVKGIFAIGDCIPGPMLAHKGEEEGVAVAENLAGQHGHVNWAESSSTGRSPSPPATCVPATVCR